MDYWGYHSVFDCWDCDRTAIQDKNTVRNFITTLVKDIDMVPIGNPQISQTAIGQDDKEGFTAIQIIETSSITAHFINSTGSLYLDVFSCKKFDREIVQMLIKQFFNPKSIRKESLIRDANPFRND
jgi:S-adenosylmethionine/arginine decarboxylase-like enzyme|tara:strand:+ start:962 stop:1339 length:378 start_codon:yes stop_codon:yes gene_type:complete